MTLSRKAANPKGHTHATLKKLENGVFNVKSHQMFSVHTAPEKFEKRQQSAIILNLCLKKSLAGKSQRILK